MRDHMQSLAEILAALSGAPCVSCHSSYRIQ